MWLPVSKIMRKHSKEGQEEFKLMSKEKKREMMSKNIDSLVKDNAEYFRGKELLFDN